MGELADGLPAPIQEEAQSSVNDTRRATTAEHDLGIRLRIQFELIAECYGLSPGDAIEDNFFIRWQDEGHAGWFNDFIHNDPETVALLQEGKVEEAKIKIREAFKIEEAGIVREVH